MSETDRDRGALAIRSGIALATLDHVSALAVSGSAAVSALERLTTGDLRIRDGRMRASLILDERGAPVFDLDLCRDDDRYLLLAEGPPASDLEARLRDAASGNLSGNLVGNLLIERFDRSHRMLALTGPYAWELMSAIVGSEVVALPHGSFFRFEDWLCFRAGKTGEYSYDLLVPEARFDSLKSRLLDEGRRFDLASASLADLDRAALESGRFNIRREGASGATALELQLQWRLHGKRKHIGAEALLSQKAAGIPRRTTAIFARSAFANGDPVLFSDSQIGTIVNADRSIVRGDFVGLALLDRAWAHAGIDRYTVLHDGARISVTTASLPLIDARSLFLSPGKHRYADRAQHAFPPIA